MRIVTSRKDIVWNYFGTAVSLGSNFILLPFLVHYLNGNELGLWYVYLSIGSLVMLFEFGFNPTFARNFAFCWGGAQELVREGKSDVISETVNRDLLASLLSASRSVYGIVTAVATVLLAFPGTWYILHVSESLDRRYVLVSWVVYCVSVLINLYFLYFAALLRGAGLVATDNRIKIVSRVLQVGLSAVLLWTGAGLFGAAIGFLVGAVLYRVLGSIVFWRDERVSALDLKRVYVDKVSRREIYSTISFNAYRDGLVQIANFGSTQSSSIICSMFLTLTETGEFSLALQLATGLSSIALALVNSYRPMIQADFQRGDAFSIRKAVGKGAVGYLLVYMLGYGLLMVLIVPLINVVGAHLAFDALLFSGISIYVLLFGWHSLFSSVLSCMNQIPYLGAYALSALAGIVLSIVLVGVFGMGAWGLVLGMAMPNLAYNNWKWPRYTSRRLDSTVSRLLKIGGRELCGIKS